MAAAESVVRQMTAGLPARYVSETVRQILVEAVQRGDRSWAQRYVDGLANIARTQGERLEEAPAGDIAAKAKDWSKRLMRRD